MSLDEARVVLYKYYTKEQLKEIYKRKDLDNSSTDTTKKLFLLPAELLRKEAIKSMRSEHERKECFQAAQIFEDKYNEEYWKE